MLAAVDEIAAAAPALSDRTDEELFAYRRRLIVLGGRAMTVELAVAAAAVADFQQLEAFLTTHLGEREAASVAQHVTTGAGTPRQRTATMSGRSSPVPPGPRPAAPLPFAGHPVRNVSPRDARSNSGSARTRVGGGAAC